MSALGGVRCFLVAAGVAQVLAAPAAGSCASAKPGSLSVWNYILVQKAPNLPASISQAADAAASKWASQCGVAIIPEFWPWPSNPPANFSIVNLLYSGATSPSPMVCGQFIGTNITIYEYYKKSDGSLGRCTQQNLVDIIAHEYGFSVHRCSFIKVRSGVVSEAVFLNSRGKW